MGGVWDLQVEVDAQGRPQEEREFHACACCPLERDRTCSSTPRHPRGMPWPAKTCQTWPPSILYNHSGSHQTSNPPMIHQPPSPLRPLLFLLQRSTGRGWPSGHSMIPPARITKEKHLGSPPIHPILPPPPDENVLHSKNRSTGSPQEEAERILRFSALERSKARNKHL